MKKQLSLFGIILATAFAASAVKASEIKVGTVDLQKALQEVKAGRDARFKLEKEFNEKKKKIEEEQAGLKKTQEELEKMSKNVALSASAKEKKVADFQKRAAAFQDLVQRSQGEMQQREVELTKPIIDGLRSTVPDVAKSKKMDLVFEANSVGPTGVSSNPLLFAQEKTDLTDEVIKVYDEKTK